MMKSVVLVIISVYLLASAYAGTLTLTTQATKAAAIQTQIVVLRNQLDQRIEVWNKLSREKKIAWVKNDKDPIMGVAWNVSKYLVKNFPDMIQAAQEGQQ